MVKLLIHGVPDTPAMWGPLIEALNLPPEEVHTPALPGFVGAMPSGFTPTKEGYADWLVAEIERIGGPVDLVGHDWGALLALRAATLTPDLIRTWAVADAVPTPGKRWHATARIWQTPVMGELFMLGATPGRLKRELAKAGMPEDLAAIEAPAVRWTMKRAILRLYRSAILVGDEWGTDLSALPNRGLLLWGEKDPFIRLKAARQFSDTWGVPLHVEEGAGHWMPWERAGAMAARLKTFWAD